MSPQQIENYRRFLTGKFGPIAAQMPDRRIEEHRDAMQGSIDRICGIEPLGRDRDTQGLTTADRIRAMKRRRARPARRR